MHISRTLLSFMAPQFYAADYLRVDDYQDAAKTTVLGIVGTGGGLSIGANAHLDVSTPNLSHAFKLVDATERYDVHAPNAKNLSLAPLSEPIRPEGYGDVYPENILGLSPHSAMACQIAALAANLQKSKLKTAHSVVGAFAAPLETLGRGGSNQAYAASLFETQALYRLAREQGFDFYAGAVVMTGGEADAGDELYDHHLINFAHNYSRDLQDITGQFGRVVTIISQQHTAPAEKNTASTTADLAYRASLKDSRHVVMAGPKYQYDYVDTWHMNAPNYERLGEKLGEVFFEHVIKRAPWAPLRPRDMHWLNNTAIRLQFDVRFPPLNWDFALPMPHARRVAWQRGRGFEVVDRLGAEVTIKDIMLDAQRHQVTLNMADTRGRDLLLSYAMVQDDDPWQGGRRVGRWGQLRDSDPLEPASRKTLSCSIATDSTHLLCVNGLSACAVGDIVTPGAYPLAQVISDTEATLAWAWRHEARQGTFRIGHEQRNYLVSFQARLP